MKTKKKKSGKASKLTNALVQTASVSVTVFSIIMLVLNMPIVAYTDTKSKETENMLKVFPPWYSGLGIQLQWLRSL